MIKRIVSTGCFFALAQLIAAPAIPPEITDPEERELLALAVRFSHVSMAYRTVAVEKMLGEANYVCERLKLPLPHPIQPSAAKIFVMPLWGSKIDSTNTSLSRADRIRAATFYASGTITTTNFVFGVSGKLTMVYRSKIRNEDSIFELYPELAKTPSLIDTNGAYHLATQWLSAVSVDVPALERKYKLHLSQLFFWGRPEDLSQDHWTYRPATATNKTLLPIFDVNWGDTNSPAVSVRVLGTTKELMDLRMVDLSFSHRPSLLITNAMELNDVPDPPVKVLQPGLRTNAVTRKNAASERPPPFRQKTKND